MRGNFRQEKSVKPKSWKPAGMAGLFWMKRPPHRVPGELLVDQRVVAQQAAVCAKGDAADVAPQRVIRVCLHVGLQPVLAHKLLETEWAVRHLLGFPLRVTQRPVLHHLFGWRRVFLLRLRFVTQFPLGGQPPALQWGWGGCSWRAVGVLLVDLHVSVHVPVGGEGLPADGTLVGPLPGVHQHVPVQGAGRAQRLPADAARVVGPTRVRVVLANVHG